MIQSPLKPTIGRAVHYHLRYGQDLKPHSANIADILDDAGRVNLSFVLHSGEMASAQGVSFSLEPRAGCWSWPPRV